MSTLEALGRDVIGPAFCLHVERVIQCNFEKPPKEDVSSGRIVEQTSY